MTARRSSYASAIEGRRIAGATVWIWSTIAALLATDAIWLSLSPMSVSRAGAVRPLAATVLLLIIAIIYAMTGRSDAIARAAHSAAQLIAFSGVAAVLSYLVTATHAPLMDGGFALADSRLGFDWNQWVRWLEVHPALHETLAISYALLLPALIVSLLWLALAGWGDELIGTFMISALITIACSGFVPAIGHLPHAPQVAQVIGLRAGTLREIPLLNPQGLIAFPSFHTTLALVIAWSARRARWLFPAMCVLAVPILVSVPSEGGHYLVDVIAGGVVAGMAIAAGAYVTRAAVLATPATSRQRDGRPILEATAMASTAVPVESRAS